MAPSTRSLLAVLLVAALAACAAAGALPRRVSYGRAPARFFAPGAGAEWTLVGRSHGAERVPLVFAVHQNAELVAELLDAVSDPRSPSYGQHLTLAQLTALLADDAAVAAVVAFVRAHHAENIEVLPGRDFVRVSMRVDDAEAALATEFHTFVERDGRRVIHRAAEYSLPAELAPHVDFVGHTIVFPAPRMAIRAHVGAPGSVTPKFLFQYYNVADSHVSGSNATQAVYENLKQYYNPSDLKKFQSTYGLDNNPVSKVIGPNHPTDCYFDPNTCVEASLDVEYIMAMAQGAPTTFWSISDEDEPFLTWVTQLAGTSNPPLVHSISYGSIESEGPVSTYDRFNTEIAKLGVRGLSVFVSSGDDGVANFQARGDQSKCGFNPSYPATSPYVTAVGATMGPEMGDAETACTSALGGGITTGGGFSTYFAQPSYQADAVRSYMNSGVQLPPASQYNGTGRGYPDIGILGHDYHIYVGGQDSQGSGTSASAPVLAGMITLINDARMAAGKSPIGFANPALYQFLAQGGVFNDVTKGENNCCAGDPGSAVCCKYGFYAAAGWDPLTGVGAVQFPALKAAFMSI